MGYQQIGATVMMCTDPTDIIVPVGKLCEYTGFKAGQTLCTWLFVLLWIPLRIGLYGYKVLWSISVGDYAAQVRPYFWSMLICAGLLVIYVLQLYWTRILLMVVYAKVVKGQEMADVRSDDDDDEPQDHNKKSR